MCITYMESQKSYILYCTEPRRIDRRSIWRLISLDATDRLSVDSLCAACCNLVVPPRRWERKRPQGWAGGVVLSNNLLLFGSSVKSCQLSSTLNRHQFIQCFAFVIGWLTSFHQHEYLSYLWCLYHVIRHMVEFAVNSDVMSKELVQCI